MNDYAKYLTIKNERLCAEISPIGAELKSVVFCGKQRLWQGNERFWKGSSPILFPICGSLKNRKYTYLGNEYKLEPHGFARKSLFKVVEQRSDYALFKLESSTETRSCYPFEFDFYVSYALEGDSIKVRYKAVNNSLTDMWLSMGSHESYLLYDDFSNHSLVFSEKEKLATLIVNCADGLIWNERKVISVDGRLNLSYDLFSTDTLVFDNVKSRKVALMRGDKKIAELSFDAPNILIWTVDGAPYVCIEPWFNLPDFEDSDNDIMKKSGLVTISGGSCYENVHAVTYYED